MIYQFKLGTDPEVAFTNKDGEVIPAKVVFDNNGIQYRTVEKVQLENNRIIRYHHFDFDSNMSLVVDGASNEFNISPSEDTAVLVDRLGKCLAKTKEIAGQVGLSFKIRPTIAITQRQIEEGGIECSVFGCDPDRNPYGDSFSPSDIDPKLTFNRFFGGHIHSSPNPDMDGGVDWIDQNVLWVCVANDLLVGLADVLIDPSKDARNRRQVYGRVGRHRIQPHGFEYRTPGNTYLCSPELTDMMFQFTAAASYMATKQTKLKPFISRLGGIGAVIRTINSVDDNSARAIWSKVKKLISENLDGFLPDGLLDLPLKVNKLGGVLDSKYGQVEANWGI